MSRESNEEQRIEAERLRAVTAAIQALCSQADFRLFISQVLRDFQAFENSGLGPQTFQNNALLSSFEQGKMAAVQYLVNVLTSVQPDFYITLLKEHLNVQSRRSQRLADLTDAGGDTADSE